MVHPCDIIARHLPGGSEGFRGTAVGGCKGDWSGRETLIDGGVDRIGIRRTDVAAQTNHLVVEEKPAFLGLRVEGIFGVVHLIGHHAVCAVAHAARKGALPLRAPLTRLGNGRDGRHGCSRQMRPIPNDGDVGIFLSCACNPRAALGHKIPLEVSAVSVFATKRAR